MGGVLTKHWFCDMRELSFPSKDHKNKSFFFRKTDVFISKAFYAVKNYSFANERLVSELMNPLSRMQKFALKLTYKLGYITHIDETVKLHISAKRSLLRLM